MYIEMLQICTHIQCIVHAHCTQYLYQLETVPKFCNGSFNLNIMFISKMAVTVGVNVAIHAEVHMTQCTLHQDKLMLPYQWITYHPSEHLPKGALATS